MNGLFPEWSDTVLRVVLAGVGFAAIAIPSGLMIYVRMPYDQNRMSPIEQPVAFDHRHHVRDDGIACLYCHTDAARSSSAGIPATEVCMGCHSQIWQKSRLLAPVRESAYADRPLRWNRVHRLPDFVFFNHSVHVRNGVACEECHGDVAQMPMVYKTRSLTMEFCLDCHRHPEQRVPGYADTVAPLRSGSKPALHVAVLSNQLATCTACHR